MWIPTTESLPKQQQVVLAVVGAGKSRRVAVLRACYPEPGVHDDDEFGWFDIEGRDWVLPVTHWSPLPSLPGVAAPAPAVDPGGTCEHRSRKNIAPEGEKLKTTR